MSKSGAPSLPNPGICFPGSAPIWSGSRPIAAAPAMSRRSSAANAPPRDPRREPGAERQAINAPPQGSATDIIKRAMARIPAALAREGLETCMLLQVHDELLFEAPEGEVEH